MLEAGKAFTAANRFVSLHLKFALQLADYVYGGVSSTVSLH